MHIVTRKICIIFLLCLLHLAAALGAYAQDISSGGLPIITGTQGGSVSGSSSNTTNLSVNINFGEVSPSNTNPIVKVVVPIAIRGTSAYKINASVSASSNVNLQAMQPSDIGFGIDNVRRTGGFFSRNCSVSSHTIYSPFDNDPASNASILPSGRVAYPGTLSNLSGSPVVLSGPPPSFILGGRFDGNEWTFDAIFTITPQFYAPGSAAATVTFTISNGPNVPC